MALRMAHFRLLFLLGAGAMLAMLAFRPQTAKLVDAKGTQVSTRFLLPPGYTRVSPAPGSFAGYLQKLPLKADGADVHYYNGVKKPNQVAAAVLSVDVGAKDLQQCADAVMRLRAEYLFAAKQYEALHFNFTSGFNAQYSKWRSGYRIRVNGNQVSWVATSRESTSYSSFREYLDIVFTYAGTASLSKELKPVPLTQMQIGDVFIRGGSPGHAVIVVDMAANPKTGKKLFMVAQSYMPAQDIHILINTNAPALSPWYELDATASDIHTPEWRFSASELKRF